MELKEFRELYDSMVLPEESDKRILDSIMQENFNINGKEENIMDKKGKTTVLKTWRIAVAALATVLVVGAGAYAATQIWNSNVAKEFNVEDKPEKMKEMSDKGYSQYMEDVDKSNDNTILSVTDNDITVSIVQTLADKNCAYVYFEAEFGDQYTPVMKEENEMSDTFLADADVDFDTGNVLVNWAGGIANIINDHKIAYSYHFYTADLSQSLEGIEFGINIRKFTVKDCDLKSNVFAEGKWDFKWNLSCGTEKRVYTINKTVNIKGFDFKFKTLTISPLSYHLVVQEEGWSKKDLRRYKKMADEGGIAYFITGFKLSDSVFKEMGGSWITHGLHKPVVLKESTLFNGILDLDKLNEIVLVDNQKISLEDCSYSIPE